MKQFIGLLLLLGLALAMDDTTTFDEEEAFVGEEVMVEESTVEGSAFLCKNCRTDNKCGANKAHPIKKSLGAGACGRGDFAHFYNVASKEECAEKCRSKRSNAKFIEYSSSRKRCDCDPSTTSCNLCCRSNGFTVYELNPATTGACPSGKCCKNNSCGNCCMSFKTVGSGACSSGDFARYSNVKSKEECGQKCKAKKSSVKFIEYNAGSKKCDCDNGSSCRLCCTRSSGKGFTSYQIGGALACSWKPWGAYGKCSKSCGGGTKTRTRGQNAAVCGGKACTGSASQSVSCNTQACCSLKKVGAGACSSGDFARYSNIASKEACAKKCKARKSSVKYIEYNAGSKKCDCDNGSSCRLCCTRSSGRGFTSYQLLSGCTLSEEDEVEEEEVDPETMEIQSEMMQAADEETMSVGTTQVAAGAGVLAVALFGAYKLATRRSAEYESLLEA